eukprot:SAG22_NODE_1114_length_5527_cov_206.317797_3_plen_88_part_00
MDLFNLNNDILGIIQHKVFLKKLIEHRDKFKINIDLEDLDRTTERDGYYFEDYFFMPFYDSDGNVFRHMCQHSRCKNPKPIIRLLMD